MEIEIPTVALNHFRIKNNETNFGLKTDFIFDLLFHVRKSKNQLFLIKLCYIFSYELFTYFVALFNRNRACSSTDMAWLPYPDASVYKIQVSITFSVE